MIIIRVKNKDYQFVKPYYLMDTELFRLRKAVVKAGGLVWNIKGEQISYKQIKTKKMEHENRTEKALMLIANALSATEVNEIVNHYKNDILFDANAIIDAGAKRIEELGGK